jgi:hypothetical protein
LRKNKEKKNSKGRELNNQENKDRKEERRKRYLALRDEYRERCEKRRVFFG